MVEAIETLRGLDEQVEMWQEEWDSMSERWRDSRKGEAINEWLDGLRGLAYAISEVELEWKE